MAIKRMTINGFASLELNRASAPISGRVIADLDLDGFVEGTNDPAENGMILAYNYATGKVTLPSGSDETFGLHYSTEKEYYTHEVGLNKFKLFEGGFKPRLLIPAVGDRYTTNAIAYDDTEFVTEAALETALEGIATTPLFGVPCANGGIKVTATAGTGSLILRVAKYTTVPNGDVGVKFDVIKGQ